MILLLKLFCLCGAQPYGKAIFLHYGDKNSKYEIRQSSSFEIILPSNEENKATQKTTLMANKQVIEFADAILFIPA